MPKLRVLVGVNYRDPKGHGEVRVEAGEVADLPDSVAKNLLAQGCAEPVTASRPDRLDPEEGDK